MTLYNVFCDLDQHSVCKLPQCDCSCHSHQERKAALLKGELKEALTKVSYGFWAQRELSHPTIEKVGALVDDCWPVWDTRLKAVATVVIWSGCSHEDWSRERVEEAYTKLFPTV